MIDLRLGFRCLWAITVGAGSGSVASVAVTVTVAAGIAAVPPSPDAPRLPATPPTINPPPTAARDNANQPNVFLFGRWPWGRLGCGPCGG